MNEIDPRPTNRDPHPTTEREKEQMRKRERSRLKKEKKRAQLPVVPATGRVITAKEIADARDDYD